MQTKFEMVILADFRNEKMKNPRVIEGSCSVCPESRQTAARFRGGRNGDLHSTGPFDPSTLLRVEPGAPI